MHKIATFALFALFLAAYTYQKYQAAAPPIFVPEYLRVVLVIVAITAVAPFALLYLGGGLIKPFPVYAIAAPLFSVALSALGFVGFWYFTISQSPEAPPVLEMARRGIAPGLVMGAILVLGRWLRDRAVTATPSS
jgi:hypothetical protein